MYLHIQRFLTFLSRLSLQKSPLVSKWVSSLSTTRVTLVWFRRMMTSCHWLSSSRLPPVCCVRPRLSWVDPVTKKKKDIKIKRGGYNQVSNSPFLLKQFFYLVNVFFVRWSATYHLVFQKMVSYLHSCNTVYVHVSYDILVVSSVCQKKKNSPVSGFIGNFNSLQKQTIIGIWRVEKKVRFTQVNTKQQIPPVQLKSNKISLVAIGIKQHSVLVARFEAELDQIFRGARRWVQGRKVIVDVTFT